MHALLHSLLVLTQASVEPVPGELVREVPLPQTEACVSEAEWQRMRTRAEANIAELQRRGIVPEVFAEGTVLFDWPLRAAKGFEDFGYHAISGYRDHALGAGAVQDYECGARTYDGHNGTDYVLFPFHWYKMDHSEVEVIAAAGGILFDRVDGMNDRSCTPGGASNKVAILHDDGTRAWYLHLKRNSVTAKSIGARIETGEYLGVVGSSGNSALPHLHFDVRDPNWVTFDPYDGDCNGVITGSRWIDQRGYYDSAITAVRTHGAPPVFPPCPQQETPNYQDLFYGGETVYFGVYHRDLLAGQLVQVQVIRPDGSVAYAGSYSGTKSHYAAAYALPSYDLPSYPQGGRWTIAVDYQGLQYEWPFQVRPRVAQPGAAPLPGPAVQLFLLQQLWPQALLRQGF